jgi:hypothetical protein
MTSNLQLGIAIPEFVSDRAFDPAAFRTYLARAKRSASTVPGRWSRSSGRRRS